MDAAGPAVDAYPATPALPPGRLGRRDLVAGLVTVLGLAVLGVPVGLLWATTSPRALAVQAAGGARLVDPETKAFIAADGRFLLATALVGLLCGTVAWLLGRRHREAVVVALAVGGLLAAVIAWRTGHQLQLNSYRHALRTTAPGERFAAAVDVRAKGVLVGWPVAALLGFMGLSLLGEHDEHAPDADDRHLEAP